ncbi:hypothetical protein, partial [Klebsiella pneumoniae]|uniref:hypothetical protein n=1 Tax=Klebsiella pneumoniae TaxID=573 RepID=UPI0033390BF7
GFAENTDDLFVGKTLLHGDVLMWLMKTLLTSGCTNQRGAGHFSRFTWGRFLHNKPDMTAGREDVEGKVTAQRYKPLF